MSDSMIIRSIFRDYSVHFISDFAPVLNSFADKHAFFIIDALVDKKVRRNEKLVAIGGGIIQDVTAFSASIIYRGIEWTFFPTTLLAQADSCIGSKTSINLGDKKNLVGNFYPPSDVFIDMTYLNSLAVDDIKSGIGEI